jgi:hypothetical protein
VIESLQKNAGQEANGIRGAKIEWALTDSVDRFFQKLAHFSHTFQRPLWEFTYFTPPTPILPSALSTQLRQLFGMSMAKAQTAPHSRRPARTASLRPSLAPLLAPLFRAFFYLKLDGGTLRCRRD